MRNANKTFQVVSVALLLAIGLCLLYSIYTLFFPISTVIQPDSAEHLHAVYLLSIGQRPYLDFIQNHPMLFHHFLGWIERSFNLASSSDLALVARMIVFGHFLVCLTVFALWAGRLVKKRPKGLVWIGMLIAAWAVLDLYNPGFHWMWDIRPDFICYGQTLLGLYLIYLWIEKAEGGNDRGALLGAVVGGCLIGFGNAVIPKGIPFLAAFGLSACTVAMLNGREAVLKWTSRRRVGGLVGIGFAALLSFGVAMAVDAHLSRVPIQKWIAAVFLLNSRKHIIFSNMESNPVTILMDTFAVSLPLALALIGWTVWELVRVGQRDRQKDGTAVIWLFSIYTIAVNVLLPTFSNGVIWSYYFIPSVFAAAAICLMMFLRLLHFYQAHPFRGDVSIAHAVIVLMVGIIGVKLINAPIYSLLQWQARQSAAREVEAVSPETFNIDAVMPKDFVYLGSPDRIPIKSRHWGYYFMLAHSTDFWKDCHAFGLGPDPRKVWGAGFGTHPPDAIAMTRSGELADFVYVVRRCQQIDVSWLLEEIRDNYVLMGRRQASLYVRQDRISYLESRGWRKLFRIENFRESNDSGLPQPDRTRTSPIPVQNPS